MTRSSIVRLSKQERKSQINQLLSEDRYLTAREIAEKLDLAVNYVSYFLRSMMQHEVWIYKIQFYNRNSHGMVNRNFYSIQFREDVLPQSELQLICDKYDLSIQTYRGFKVNE
jgi:hypothetical protein